MDEQPIQQEIPAPQPPQPMVQEDVGQQEATQETTEVNPVNKNELRRTLGFTALFLITINAIFGSSLSYLPGLGMQLAGPSSILMWIGVFLIGIYIAMCLGELISLFPRTGDIYNFARKAYGHFTAFIVGWISWIAGNIVASLSTVWALEYLWPEATLMAFAIKLAIAIGVIIFLNAVVFYGMKLSNVLMSTLAVISLSLLVLQILPFFIDIQTLFTSGAVLSPFDAGRFMPFFLHGGWSTNLIYLFATLFIIAEAFMGLEGITFLSSETKNPERILPKALMAAIITAAIVMLLYVVGSIGVFPIGEYTSALLPHKDMLGVVWSGFMAQLLIAGTGLIIITPAAAWIVTGPRLLMSLAKDKLFLKQHAQIHRKWKTPFRAIRFQTFAIILSTTFIYYLYMRGHHDPYRLVHEVFIMLVLIMLSLVVLCVPIFRKRMPEAQRHYKAPFGKIGPILLVLVFIAMAYSYFALTGEYHIIGKALSLILVGVPVFLFLILYYNPETTRKAYSSISWLSLSLEGITLPKRIRKKMIKTIGDVEQRRVLEFGASVGTLTTEIAKKVGPLGQVYAVDFSKSNIATIQKRMKKKKHEHVHAIHDEHMVNRVHPEVPEVDVILSIGAMDHIQDMKKVLKEMAYVLPEQGKICMVEYADFFGVLPNSGWLADTQTLQEMFKEAGFSVKITKWKSFLWNYFVIYGVKTKEDVVMV